MVERAIGVVMVHRRIGAIPFLSRPIARFKVSRAEAAVNKLVNRIKKACLTAPEVRIKLERALDAAREADALKSTERAERALVRFDKIHAACTEGSEIPKAEAKKDIKDTRRGEFLEAGKFCNRQVGIVTRSDPKQREDWAACMKAKGFQKVEKYLTTPEREDFPL